MTGMASVTTAFARAVRDLAQPRVLAVLFVPMIGALALWSVLGWFFWDTWTDWIRAFLDGTSFGGWLIAREMTWLLSTLTIVLALGLVAPAVLITAVLITEIIAMPVIVSVVGKRYAQLERRSGGTLLPSIANALTAIAVFALLWLVTLPLWFTGVGALLLPALNSAYLNQRLFRHDALSEHASAEEYRHITKSAKGSLYLLGLLLAVLYYVPVFNLVVPTLSGLAFTHFCLQALEDLRRNVRAAA
jgi:uncharacterized protein involved in cysteine biosynthesis